MAISFNLITFSDRKYDFKILIILIYLPAIVASIELTPRDRSYIDNTTLELRRISPTMTRSVISYYSY